MGVGALFSTAGPKTSVAGQVLLQKASVAHHTAFVQTHKGRNCGGTNSRANDGSRPGLDKNKLGGLLLLAAGMVLLGTQRRARAVLSLSSQERSFQIYL